MFNNKKVITYDSEAEKVVTLIGTGAVCDGPFSSKDSTRVDGTINGAVRIDGSLIIGQTGKINGNIKAQNVVLLGALLKRLGLNEIDWDALVARMVPEKFKELNLKALEAGRNL